MDAEETAATLPYKQLVDAMEEILRDKVAGRVTAPVPSVTPLGTVGTLESTTFIDGDVAVVDVRTLHPANPSGGEPFVQGSVLLHDVRTGRLLRTLDGTTFTARRAAAVSALAARVLAPDPTGRMMVIGAGTLARAHMQAFHDALGTSEVFVLSRSEHRAMQAVEFARRIGLRARAVDLSTATVDYVTLIVTATTSTTPIVFGRVRDDGFVSAVGSYRADMAELPEELVHRGFLFIDNPEQAHLRAGDFINAGIDLSTVFPLEAVLDAARPGTGPVVFENCGDYLFDIAAVRTSLAVKPPTPEEWGREPTPAEAEVLRPERIALPKAQPGQLPRGGPIEMGPAGRDRSVDAGAPEPSVPEPTGPIAVGPIVADPASSEPIPVGPVSGATPGPVTDGGDVPPVMNGSVPEAVVTEQSAPPMYEPPVYEPPVEQAPSVYEPPPAYVPPVEQVPQAPAYEPPVEQAPPAYEPPPAYAPPVEQVPQAPVYEPPPAYAPPVEPVAQQPVDPNLPPLAPPQPDASVPAWAPPQFDPTSQFVEPAPVAPPANPPVQPPVYEPPAAPPAYEPPPAPQPAYDAPPPAQVPPPPAPPADGATDGSEPPEPPGSDVGRVWVPPVS